MAQGTDSDWVEELARKVVERLPLQQDYSPDMKVNDLFVTHYRQKGHITDTEHQQLLAGRLDDLEHFREELRRLGH